MKETYQLWVCVYVSHILSCWIQVSTYHPISCQSGYLYSCLTHSQRAQGGGRASLTLPIGLPRGDFNRSSLSAQTITKVPDHDWNMTQTWPLTPHYTTSPRQRQQPPRKRRSLFTRATHKFSQNQKQSNLNNATFFELLKSAFSVATTTKKNLVFLTVVLVLGILLVQTEGGVMQIRK